jgi:hypothetical protein
MLNKSVSVVSFAAVAAVLVFACSSDPATSTSSSSGGTADGGGSTSSSGGSSGTKDSGKTDAKPSGSSSGSTGGIACPPVAIAKEALDDFYKAPADAVPGACTGAEIDALDTASKDPNAQTWDDVLTGWKATNPSANCTSCAIGKASDAKWKTFVSEYAFDASNTGSFLYWGQCGKAATPSKKDACGEIAHKFRYAYVAGCGACTDDAEFDECRTACYEDDGSCQAAAENWIGDCPPAEVNTALNKCNGIKAVLTVSCGGGGSSTSSSSGGTDAAGGG